MPAATVDEKCRLASWFLADQFLNLHLVLWSFEWAEFSALDNWSFAF